ncbi:hypothetical protein K9L16_02820 [Candidatus Pacearchaeota archaeon]|nr:hypothetical protein [Candidatus Pacearchaeota archaeon]
MISKNNISILRFFSLLLFGILFFSIISAEVGVGISPSKLKFQIIGGSEYEQEITVFNTGTYDSEIFLVAEGDIAGFTEITPKSVVVSPEPKPHELPLKNSQTFLVKFDPPSVAEKTTYSGSLSAVGSGSSDSTFGGKVGVTAQVVIENVPSDSFFSKISQTHVIITCIIIILILIFFVLKDTDISIKFKKK